MRRPDGIGVALIGALAVALVGGGESLIASDLIKPWELVAVIGFGGVLVATARPRATRAPPRNTHVHGAARPADEYEAKAAALGGKKSAPMYEAHFKE